MIVTQGGNKRIPEETVIGLVGVLEFCASEITRVEKLRRHHADRGLSEKLNGRTD